MISSDGLLLTRNPRAPASRACRTERASPYMERISTFISGKALRMQRLASMPLPSGIMRSMRTMSGCRS
nr:hypothetical protein [Geomonas diazotrophica]